MPLTKRNLALRISEETGLIQTFLAAAEPDEQISMRRTN